MKKLMIFLLFTVFISCGEDSVQKNDADTEIAENEQFYDDTEKTDADETADIDQAGDPFYEEWTIYWGLEQSLQSDIGKSVAVSKDGSIFVAGENIEFSEENENSGNSFKPFFLTKISPDGKIIWNILNDIIGSVAEGKTIATDTRNNCFAVSNSSEYLSITKFNNSGTIELCRQFNKQYHINSIAIDKSGNIFAGGFNDSSKKPYLMKTDKEIYKLWENEWDEDNHFMVEAVATDISGNVYVSGRTEDNPDSDGGGQRSESFIIKFDGNGKKLWSKNWGVTGKWTVANSISVDSDGSIFVSGMTSGTFEGNVSAGDTDIFLTKFNSGSEIEWTKQFGTDAWDSGYSMTIDGKGHVIVTGSASNSKYCKDNGCRDSFLVSIFDYEGIAIYFKEWNNGGQSDIYSIASDMNGNVFFTGFNENFDNDGSVFLSRFSLNGSDEETADNETDDEDAVIDEENCRQADGGTDTFINVTYEEDKCANPGERTFRMLYLIEPVDHTIIDAEHPGMTCTMTIDNIEGGEIENFSADVTIPESDFYYVSEKQIYTDISGVAEGEKCWGADRYTIRFNGYESDFFNDSMIGKKIVFYTGPVYWGYEKVHAVAYEDGTWIAVNRVMPANFGLKPDLIAYRSTMLDCAVHCVYGMGYDGYDIPNYTIQPPVQFDVEGLDEVVLIRNGESQIIGDYEFYADFSVAISDKDPDGIFTVEADYDPLPSPKGEFYFSILNIKALE